MAGQERLQAAADQRRVPGTIFRFLVILSLAPDWSILIVLAFKWSLLLL